ncbi:unnamed protein product, partial [Allacma fusca]
VYGVLDGAGGVNTLIIDKSSYYPKQVVDVTLGCESCALKIRNIQKVLGRASDPDVVTVDYKTTDIDLQGGSDSSKPDIIKIPYTFSTLFYHSTSNSNNLFIQLGSHTSVENSAYNGTFIYDMNTYVTNVAVNIKYGNKNSQKHRFQWLELRTMRFIRKSSHLEVSSYGTVIL